MVDHEVGDASAYQPLDVPHDERLAARLQQGLGRVVGERTHAFTATGGQDHCFQVEAPALAACCSNSIRILSKGLRSI